MCVTRERHFCEENSYYNMFDSGVFGTFCTVSAKTVNRRWQYPTKIKTYIPQNHKRTIMMKHAFAEWSRLTNNKIIFRYVDSPKMAQVVVQFVNVVPNAEREIGLTKSSFTSAGGMLRATNLYCRKNLKRLSAGKRRCLYGNAS